MLNVVVITYIFEQKIIIKFSSVIKASNLDNTVVEIQVIEVVERFVDTFVHWYVPAPTWRILGCLLPWFIRTWNFDIQNKLARSYKSWAVCSLFNLDLEFRYSKQIREELQILDGISPCFIRTWNFDIQNKFARSYKSWTVYSPVLY